MKAPLHFHPATPLQAVAQYCYEHNATVRVTWRRGPSGAVLPSLIVEDSADAAFVPAFIRADSFVPVIVRERMPHVHDWQQVSSHAGGRWICSRCRQDRRQDFKPETVDG